MFEVLKYIHEHITAHLNVAEVAAHFGYSKWYFCEKFRLFTKKTFNEYVRSYRMQAAAIDILSGKKVLDIAFDYGYDSMGGFNKAFLKEFGCLPREYKNRAKESLLYSERRKGSMYMVSDRCMLLREKAVNTKSDMKKYCWQRHVYYALGAAAAAEAKRDAAEVFAAGTAHVLQKFTPYIAPNERIVGFNFGDAQYPDWAIPSTAEDDVAVMRENGISADDVQAFCALDPYYRSYEFCCGHISKPLHLTDEERAMSAEWAAIGRCIADNHSVIGYEKVLRYGFTGLLEQVERYEKQNGARPIYAGMKNICKAAVHMGEKYAAEAERLLAQGDGYNAEDLKKIASVCRRVPAYPARSFTEAVQSLWFAHIINTWEDTVNANSLGRLDQILYPYYKADIEKGVLTKEEAFEIICCLWLKLYRDYDVQQSCIGGTLLNGESAVNDLSYMMLDATESLDFIRCLSVRFSSSTEKAFLKRALEVVGHVQKGVPFFFNDDVMIPALTQAGIAREDAYDYTQIGCVETVIPGKSNPHAVTGETNLLKAVEYVLGNGSSLMHPEICCGVKTGKLASLTTYKKFYNAVLKQVDRILDVTCSQVGKYCDSCVAPKPYKSLLTEGCLQSGRDFNDRGARYDYYQIMLGGVPNLADSLAVIKKFVYEEEVYTLNELREILSADFPDESVRATFVNKAAKFGNDIDAVDCIAVDIVNHACDQLEALQEKYGRSFHAQPFTFLWMIEHGAMSAASPDGRHKGDPIAYSVSPMQGRDFNGVTAVLNSIAKFPTERTPGTTSAIVEIDPKLFTDVHVDALTDILIASGKKGLSNVQFNTVDADTLLAAKRHPEKYNNLAVRVSGFSQKFNLLSPALQDHIIGRTKHRCL